MHPFSKSTNQGRRSLHTQQRSIPDNERDNHIFKTREALTNRCANCFIVCDLYLPLCNEKNKQREGLEDLSLFNPALPCLAPTCIV